MQRAVYLDSTIPSYLFDERTSIQTYVEVTKTWWEEERQHFNIWISDATIAELSQGDYPNKAEIIACVSQLQVLPPDDHIVDITQVYLDHYLMPRGLTGDAFWLMPLITKWTSCSRGIAIISRMRTKPNRYGLSMPG
jgi:hypothetical protein